MSSSIQSLLKTEREAAELVNEARKYRTARLKSAKADAQSEIDKYKAQKEAELKAFEEEHAGLNDTIEKDAEARVQSDLESIKKSLAEKKQDVAKLLIDAATNAKPQLHINAQ